MNSRIQELAEQVTKHYPATEASGEFSTFDKEKFAELIVRECIDCLKPLSRNHSMVGAAQDTIRDHFEVEP